MPNLAGYVMGVHNNPVYASPETRTLKAWIPLVFKSDDEFGRLRNELFLLQFDEWKGRIEISSAISNTCFKLIDCMASGYEGFLARVAIEINRTGVVSEFNTIKGRAERYADKFLPTIHRANNVIEASGQEVVSLDCIPDIDGIEADKTTSCGNDDWSENMQNAFDALTEYMDAIEQSAKLCEERLGEVMNSVVMYR